MYAYMHFSHILHFMSANMLLKYKLSSQSSAFYSRPSLHFSVSAGTNKQVGTTKNTAKLDRETEELHHDTIGLDVGRLIQQGRQAKSMTQKDLATVSYISL